MLVYASAGSLNWVFYWLRVKNSNHLHTEFSLSNLKDTKFYSQIKASFIKVSSIASC